MPAPTCFSALAIEQDAMGEIVLGDLRAAQSEIAAKCLAAAMAATKPAAVAFSHTGDLSSGNLANVVILESYGDLPKWGAAPARGGDRKGRGPKKAACKTPARERGSDVSMALFCGAIAET